VLYKDSIVGKRNEYSDIDDFSMKQYVTLDDNNKRVYINVQPIQSPTGDSAVIGALYVKSDIEQKYSEIVMERATNNATTIEINPAIKEAVKKINAVLPISEYFCSQKQAVRIAQGDYSEKVDVQGHDELSQLAETFNKLSDRIEDAQDISLIVITFPRRSVAITPSVI
jgi:two-component system sensor histidine kinase VicK